MRTQPLVAQILFRKSTAQHADRSQPRAARRDRVVRGVTDDERSGWLGPYALIATSNTSGHGFEQSTSLLAVWVSTRSSMFTSFL